MELLAGTDWQHNIKLFCSNIFLTFIYRSGISKVLQHLLTIQFVPKVRILTEWR
jgi:hypothetical protein